MVAHDEEWEASEGVCELNRVFPVHVLWDESVRVGRLGEFHKYYSTCGGFGRGKESGRTAIAPLKAWALLNMRVRDVTLERIHPPGPSKSLLNDDAP